MAQPIVATRGEPGLERLRQMQFSFAPERVLSAGVQLGVFSQIAAGKKTVPEIAQAASASERGMQMLLDALVGLELLSKQSGQYELSSDAGRYLVRESPDYIGAMLEQDFMWEAFGHLAECVRSGKPFRRAGDPEVAQKIFPTMVRTFHITNGPSSGRLAEALAKARGRSGLRVLDIGCGSGVWSLAIAQADPQAHVTALDFPAVLEVTREFARKAGVERRYEFLAGDFHSIALGDRQYDLVLLGNIVHGEGHQAAQELFLRISRALRPGGQLAILDMTPNEDRTGPVFPLVFALAMLVNTESGGTYTPGEYRTWLTAAGFGRVETLEIGSHSPAILATKPQA